MSPLEALTGEITITYSVIVQVNREGGLPYQDTLFSMRTTWDRGQAHRGGERKSVCFSQGFWLAGLGRRVTARSVAAEGGLDPSPPGLCWCQPLLSQCF